PLPSSLSPTARGSLSAPPSVARPSTSSPVALASLWRLSCSAERPSRVVLTPVPVDAVDETLDAVPAQAPVLMAGRSEAHADVDHEVAKRVELRRPARVREPPSAAGALGERALSRPPGERHVGNEIVDSTEIVSRRCHV